MFNNKLKSLEDTTQEQRWALNKNTGLYMRREFKKEIGNYKQLDQNFLKPRFYAAISLLFPTMHFETIVANHVLIKHEVFKLLEKESRVRPSNPEQHQRIINDLNQCFAVVLMELRPERGQRAQLRAKI